MKTPVDDIYKIKKIREERAERNLAKAEADLRLKEKIVIEKEEALKNYQIWRVEEEEKKYAVLLKKKSVKRKSLDDLKFEIKDMRDKEIDFHQAVSKAESAVVAAEEELETAKKAYVQSIRNTEKMSEMQNSLRTELMTEAALNIEKEMEDSFQYKPKSPL